MNRRDRRLYERLKSRGWDDEEVVKEVRRKSSPSKGSPLLKMWKSIFSPFRKPSSYLTHIPKAKRPMVATGAIRVDPNGWEHPIMEMDYHKSQKMRRKLARA
ncbi:MAG TPA: hypothetical protein VJ869_11860 [Sphaerochaeta sp.]|nr:hypothetical protein [Sphaerochaeta sp.]